MKVRSAPIIVRFVLLILIVVVAAVSVSAQGSPIGKSRDLVLRLPAQAASITLPAGEYRVTHVMDGEKHVLVFKALKGERKEFRVPCKMHALDVEARHTEQHYEMTSAGDRVLTSLVFQGEKVEHVF